VKNFLFFHEKSNILVSRVEAPVVALVTKLAAEGAAAGSAAAGDRLGPLDHLDDLQVRVALAFRVAAEEVHQVRFVREEDPGGRARWWLRCHGRGRTRFPLGRWRIGTEPWRRGRVGWVRGDVDRVPADVADGLRRCSTRPHVPESLFEDHVFAFQVDHLVVEHGDVPAEGVDLAVGLARRPCLGGELVAAEGTLPLPELGEAALAGHVAALHDRGIRVGEVFQADATLR